MVTLFHDMMHKEIEVYIDEMIVKSKRGEDHVEALRKLFERLNFYIFSTYTGYIDVGSRHLFFYFFESRNDPDTDDVLLWTNGGASAGFSS